MSGNDSSFEVDLRLLLANGKKIEAIKLYRERTGAGLAEAKEAVEAFEQGESLPKTEAPSSDVDREVVSLLETARRTSARAVNAVMTATYWEIGRRIVEIEQGGFLAGQVRRNRKRRRALRRKLPRPGI